MRDFLPELIGAQIRQAAGVTVIHIRQYHSGINRFGTFLQPEVEVLCIIKPARIFSCQAGHIFKNIIVQKDTVGILPRGAAVFRS